MNIVDNFVSFHRVLNQINPMWDEEVMVKIRNIIENSIGIISFIAQLELYLLASFCGLL